MSDVSLARASWPMRSLFLFLLLILENRPVFMTAGRRDALVNDAQSLDLAMSVIAELRADLARVKGDA